MTWVDCDETHLEDIRRIFNDAILTSTALYEYAPRTPEFMRDWLAAKRRGRFPILGLTEEPGGQLLGFGTYGPFRAFPAYKYTVEHSVYVDAPHRGRGIGRMLLERLLDRAREQDRHTLVGVIDAANEASLALHRRLGFEECGRLRETGFKFGRWLDLVLVQRILRTPEHPVDG
jgi:phosphinothricin acetyltransferase